MNETFANFQKYDERGRRLSCFAEVVNNKLKICVITCSKADQFSKRVAYEGYMVYKWVEKGKMEEIDCALFVVPNPQTFEIDIVDNKPKKTFLNWCNDNFYQRRDTVERRNHEVEYLINKNGNRIIIKDRPRINKLSMY